MRLLKNEVQAFFIICKATITKPGLYQHKYSLKIGRNKKTPEFSGVFLNEVKGVC